MSFGRYEVKESNETKKIPNDWLESFTKVLTEAYFDQSEKDNSFFDVYGEIYEKEFVVIVSYIHHKEQSKSPISIFISHDIISNEKEFEKALKKLVNFTGLILDDIFSQDEWNDYINVWTENDFEGHQYFYKITRENISLSLQAEEFLRKNGDI